MQTAMTPKPRDCRGILEGTRVSLDRVEISQDGILLTRKEGSKSLLLFHELEQVEVLSLDQFYYLLNGPQVSLVVGQQAEGSDSLIRFLQALPGFRQASLVEALDLDQGQKLTCWQKPGVQPGQA